MPFESQWIGGRTTCFILLVLQQAFSVQILDQNMISQSLNHASLLVELCLVLYSLDEMGLRFMPLQLWQFIKSPFLKSLTLMPLLQSLGTFPKVHILIKRESQMGVQVLIEDFTISAGIPSIPRAHPFFNFFAVCGISSAHGGLALMSKFYNQVYSLGHRFLVC